MFKKNHLYYALPAVLVSILAVIAIVFAWQEPGDVPPLDNVPAPINVGSYFQSKSGPLTVWGQFSTATSTFLATHGGRVGIGTATIGAKLTLADHTTNTGGIRFRTAATAVDLWSSGSNILRTSAAFYADSYRVGTTQVISSTRVLSNVTADAGIITSGVFNTDRLGTGTASSDTYLRGDSTWASIPVGEGDIGGSGTANYLAKFTGEKAIGNSAVYESGGNVGIGTIEPFSELHVKGGLTLQSPHGEETVHVNLRANQGPPRGLAFWIYPGSGPDWEYAFLGDRLVFGVSRHLIFSAGGLYSRGDVAIDVDGSLGVGVLVPTQKLDVRGNAYISGDVGIGAINPSQKLDVDGTMRLRDHFYDIYNSSGVNGQVLTRATDGPAWQTPSGGGVSSREFRTCEHNGEGGAECTTPSCPAGYFSAGCTMTVIIAHGGAIRNWGSFPASNERCKCIAHESDLGMGDQKDVFIGCRNWCIK